MYHVKEEESTSAYAGGDPNYNVARDQSLIDLSSSPARHHWSQRSFMLWTKLEGRTDLELNIDPQSQRHSRPPVTRESKAFVNYFPGRHPPWSEPIISGRWKVLPCIPPSAIPQTRPLCYKHVLRPVRPWWCQSEINWSRRTLLLPLWRLIEQDVWYHAFNLQQNHWFARRKKELAFEDYWYVQYVACNSSKTVPSEILTGTTTP
jgi:hypothetical protein